MIKARYRRGVARKELHRLKAAKTGYSSPLRFDDFLRYISQTLKPFCERIRIVPRPRPSWLPSANCPRNAIVRKMKMPRLQARMMTGLTLIINQLNLMLNGTRVTAFMLGMAYRADSIIAAAAPTEKSVPTRMPLMRRVSEMACMSSYIHLNP